MPILVSCPHCDWKGNVKDELAGKKGTCPTCGEAVAIPKARAASPPPVPGSKKSAPVGNEPDVVDDGKLRPERRSRRDDDSDHPRRRRDEDDDRPAKPRRRPADEDGVPARPRKRILDDEDDEEPRRRPRRRVDDDDDVRPRRRRVDDDDDVPRKRRRQPVRSRESRNTKRVGAVVGGLIGLLLGLGLIAVVWFVRGRPSIYGVIVVVISLIGLFQGFTGVGLGGSDDGGNDGD